MLKRVLIFSFLMIFVIGATAFAAPDRVNHVDVGLNGAWTSNDHNMDDSGLVGATVSYGVTPYVALGIESSWQEASGAFGAEDIGAATILGDIILRAPQVHESLVPYGVLGLGYLGAYVTDESGDAATDNGDDVDDGGFAWKLGGGADWFINPNWIANVEISYTDSDPDLPGSSQGSNGVSYWAFGGGLKYAF